MSTSSLIFFLLYCVSFDTKKSQFTCLFMLRYYFIFKVPLHWHKFYQNLQYCNKQSMIIIHIYTYTLYNYTHIIYTHTHIYVKAMYSQDKNSNFSQLSQPFSSLLGNSARMLHVNRVYWVWFHYIKRIWM